MEKKWIIIISVVVVLIGLALAIAFCRPTEEPEEPATIGLSLSTLNNPFFVTLKEGAEDAAAAAGVTLVVVDSQDDPATEATNLEDLI